MPGEGGPPGNVKSGRGRLSPINVGGPRDGQDHPGMEHFEGTPECVSKKVRTGMAVSRGKTKWRMGGGEEIIRIKSLCTGRTDVRGDCRDGIWRFNLNVKKGQNCVVGGAVTDHQ